MSRPQTGYIRKNRSGTFSGIVRVKDPATGKSKQREVTAKTKTAAIQKLQDLLIELRRGTAPIQHATFAELAKLYKANRLQAAQFVDGVKVSGVKSTDGPATWLPIMVEHFGSLPLSKLGVAHLEAYRSARLATKTPAGNTRKISSMNREMEFLRRVLNYGVALDLIKINPFGKTHGLILKRKEAKRTRVPTFGEEMALLAVCQDDSYNKRGQLRPFIILSADTGLRRNELTTMLWSDVNFAARSLTVRPENAKTNVTRQIPMTDRVYDELKRLHESPARNDFVLGGQVEFKRSFRTACKLAKIADLHGHDFRHAFVTRSILVGVPLPMVTKASGHVSEEWQRYCNPGFDGAKALFVPLEGQQEAEVKAFARSVLAGLKSALGYDLSDLLN